MHTLQVAVLLLAICSLNLAQVVNEAELRDQNLVRRRLDCVLDKAPCDNVGRMIKAALPEVLNRGCRKCTRTQKAGARRLMMFTQQNYPAEWAQIQAKYRG